MEGRIIFEIYNEIRIILRINDVDLLLDSKAPFLYKKNG